MAVIKDKTQLIGKRSMWGVLFIVSMVLIALVLLSEATQNPGQSGHIFTMLLVTSGSGLLVLLGVVVFSGIKLWKRVRGAVPGSRFSLRLARIFVAISIIPVIVVYYFSLQFLQAGIDSWFNVSVESALEDSLELSRASLDLRMREAMKLTKRMSETLITTQDELAGLTLSELRSETDASELSLFSRSGRIIAAASLNQTSIVPDQPPDVVLLQVHQGHDYTSLDPIRDSGFHIRSVVRVEPVPGGEERVLQALFPVADRFSLLADSVRQAVESYRELVFLRSRLKTSFVLTLSLFMALGVMASLWAALFYSGYLVQPLRELADATRKVAVGNFDQQLPVPADDALGPVAESFNDMTQKLTLERDKSQLSQQQVEHERAYLEAVLARLSSGVITFDRKLRMRTCNAAAGQILGMVPGDFGGLTVSQFVQKDAQLKPFIEAIAPHLGAEPGDWREEVTLVHGARRQILTCRGSALPDVVGLRGGHLLVFDDVTTLVKAERDAAWGEVARRLAHEIKNPLTPIQLSAERLRHKLLGKLDEKQNELIDRSTHTIVGQVQAMKEMVNAFNEYARPPALNLQTIDLNAFVTDILYLYRDYPAGVQLNIDIDSRDIDIQGDALRLRQLLHNLVKNALEAVETSDNPAVTISTRIRGEESREYAELCVQDNGSGLPEHQLGDLFEPYVTTKAKGTGLGLAIVKKIVEEHSGIIHLESPATGGAQVLVRFPLRVTHKEPTLITSTPHVQPQEQKTG